MPRSKELGEAIVFVWARVSCSVGRCRRGAGGHRCVGWVSALRRPAGTTSASRGGGFSALTWGRRTSSRSVPWRGGGRRRSLPASVAFLGAGRVSGEPRVCVARRASRASGPLPISLLKRLPGEACAGVAQLCGHLAVPLSGSRFARDTASLSAGSSSPHAWGTRSVQARGAPLIDARSALLLRPRDRYARLSLCSRWNEDDPMKTLTVTRSLSLGSLLPLSLLLAACSGSDTAPPVSEAGGPGRGASGGGAGKAGGRRRRWSGRRQGRGAFTRFQ